MEWEKSQKENDLRLDSPQGTFLKNFPKNQVEFYSTIFSPVAQTFQSTQAGSTQTFAVLANESHQIEWIHERVLKTLK